MKGRIAPLFRARVGRRLFALFVLSAFVPLAALAALSFVQLRDILLQQGEQRLAATAKAYGMTLFERLLLATDLASASAAPRATPPAENSLARRSFRSLARVDADGRQTAIFGEPGAVSLDEAAHSRISQGKPVLLKAGPGLARGPTLAVASASEPGAVVLAELLPDYLWQSDLLPAATEFCVVDEATRGTLFCSAPLPEAILQSAAGRSTDATQSNLRALQWVREGESQRAVAWPQFMVLAFGTPDWVVVASQPEGFQLSRLIEYQRIYIPVVALALLLVSWLTIRQSRSILAPVARLAERSRAISRNNFAGRLNMDRSDEFGELSQAFDQMSDRLGRQFATLTALAEVDKLILSTFDAVQVVRTVLERMGEVVPADLIGITLFDPENRNRGQAFFRDMHQPADGLVHATLEVSPQDRALLESHQQGNWIGVDEHSPGILKTLLDRGIRMAYVLPIMWRGEACGALALCYRGPAEMPEDERQHAREFADRVAVAVSSARRDEQLYLHAHFDTLTGLPNRLLFKDRIGQEIARCQREDRRFAVLFVDIDRFKNVNDTLGHAAGDAVLCEAARRISSCVRESDTVSRLGGDEFTVLVTNIHHPQDAGRVADQAALSLSESFVVDGQRLFLSASVGISTFPEDGASPDELFKNADTAMYRAKAAGRAQVVYFEERMNAEAVARMTLDRDLRQAIERGELVMHYQPLFNVRTRRIEGAEALMRWNHPERGMIAPSRFIPVAEETGFIEELGQFALGQACAQVKAWRDGGLGISRVSVNVSPRQLRKPGVVEVIRRCASGAGVGLDALEIEITEGLLIDHAESVEGLLRELDAAGARIALDDFGTGFSSMAYLNRFPIHTIKIDRVFVNGLGSSRDSKAIVEAIIAMSHALGKSVVAEGVETAVQFAFLEGLGCDEIQGFHVARALPADEFRRFVLEHHRAPGAAAEG